MIQEKPIHNDKLDCFDEVLAVISKQEDRDFELSLSDAWSFELKPLTNGSIGRCICTHAENDLEVLKRIHGIDCCFASEDHRFYTWELCKLMEQFHYVVVSFDTFYCPWDKSFEVLHNPFHLMIVDEINIQTNQIYLTDPFYEMWHAPMDIDQFNRAVGRGCTIAFQPASGRFTEDELKRFFRKKLEKVLSQMNQIRFLAEYFSTSELKKELDGSNNVWHAPLIFNMGRVALGRFRFCYLLEYLQNKYGLILKEQISKLEKIAQQWNIMRAILVKIHFSGKYHSITHVRDMLIQIYSLESKVCAELLAKFQ